MLRYVHTRESLLTLDDQCIWEGLRRLYLEIRIGRNSRKSQQKTPGRVYIG